MTVANVGMSRKDVKLTVNRINDALSRRFEKDASLYISKQEIEEIKSLLYNKQYYKVFGMFKTKKHSAEVLTKTIIRNAWLMYEISDREIKDYFNPIFSVCIPQILDLVLQDVVNNRIEMPFTLKETLTPLYYERASIDECENILENRDAIKLSVLKSCLKRVIQAESNISRAYRKLNTYLKDKRLESDPKLIPVALNFEKLTVSQKKDLAEKIYEDKLIDAFQENDKPPFNWISAFTALGETALTLLVKELESCSRGDYRIRPLTGSQMLPRLINDSTEDGIGTTIEKVVSLYQRNSNIRYNLIYTLKFIKNEEVKKYLINKFQTIDIPSSARNLLNDIKYGESEIIEKLDDLIGLIENGKSPAFIVSTLNRNKPVNQKEIIKELLNEYTIENECEDFLYEYFKRLNRGTIEMCGELILKYFTENDEELTTNLTRGFLQSIETNNMRGKYARLFMQKHDFEQFKRVFGN